MRIVTGVILYSSEFGGNCMRRELAWALVYDSICKVCDRLKEFGVYGWLGPWPLRRSIIVAVRIPN